MNNPEVRKAANFLGGTAPLPYKVIIDHIVKLEEEADAILVSAIQSEVMRQNQGKVQVLRELLEDLKI